MKTLMFFNTSNFFTGLGKELFDEYSLITERASNIMGLDIKELTLKNPEGTAYQGIYSIPICFFLTALSFYQWREKNGSFDVSIGQSLGELNAIHAAGFLDIEDIFKWIKLTTNDEFYSRYNQTSKIAVVSGLTQDEFEKHIAELKFDQVKVGVENTKRDLLVGGPINDILELRRYFRNHSSNVQFLDLGKEFPFHCFPDYKLDRPEYLEFFQNLNFKKPHTALYSPVLNRFAESSDDIKQIMQTVPFAFVYWRKGIEKLLAHGVTDFESIGFGDVLTNFVNKIKSDIIT